MIAELGMAILFFASVVLFPWWLTLFLGIVFLSLFQSGWLVVIGGFVMDSAFGAPFVPVFGFYYVFTAVFFILLFVSLYLKKALSE